MKLKQLGIGKVLCTVVALALFFVGPMVQTADAAVDVVAALAVALVADDGTAVPQDEAIKKVTDDAIADLIASGVDPATAAQQVYAEMQGAIEAVVAGGGAIDIDAANQTVSNTLATALIASGVDEAAVAEVLETAGAPAAAADVVEAAVEAAAVEAADEAEAVEAVDAIEVEIDNTEPASPV